MNKQTLKFKTLLIDSTRIFLFIVLLFITLRSITYNFLLDIEDYIPSLNPFSNNFEKFDPMRLAYGENSVKIDSNIVLINLGEQNRDGIAHLLDEIVKYVPKVVAIDAFFIRPKDKFKDSLLESSLSKIPHLVLAAAINSDDHGRLKYDESYKSFSKYGESGFVQINFNKELNKAESFSPIISIDGKVRNSFSTTITKFFSPEAYNKLLKRKNSDERINFIGNHESFIVADLNDSSRINKKLIKDKIVIIGFLDVDPFGGIRTNEDVLRTPIGGSDAPDMFGMVVQANIVSMILNSNYINEPPGIIELLLVFLILYANIVALALLHYKLSKWYNAITIPYIFFVMISYLLFTTFLLVDLNFYFNPTVLIMMITLAIPVVEIYSNLKSKIDDKINNIKELMSRAITFIRRRKSKSTTETDCESTNMEDK